MKNTLLIFFVLIIASCTPRLNYLGDNYPPTTNVDIYYDEGDIKKDFKVIGQLQGDNTNNPGLSLEDIRETMIIEAKKRGAEGIWFLHSDSFGDGHLVKSKLIRYEN